MDETLDKWLKWFPNISNDVQTLLLSRDMYLDLHKIIQANPKIQKADYFHSYMRDTYMSHVGIIVRRQLKDISDSISLARLLREISERPHLISRQRFISLYGNSLTAEFANGYFDNIAGAGKSHIDPKAVVGDLTQLKSAGLTCEGFVDRRIAHHDRRPPTSVPTYGEVHSAIDLMDKLCVKYNFLLHAVSLDTMKPTVQSGWLSIFNTPWVVEEP